MAKSHNPHSDLPPPANVVGVLGWVHRNLLSTPLNIALTVLALYLLYVMLPLC